MTLTFNKVEQDLFLKLQACAAILNTQIFIIGGYVRDKILHRSTKDIDIVITMDSLTFADYVSKNYLKKASVTYFKNFGTAQLKYKDIEIQFVTARKESYEENSRNPFVKMGTIEDDQNRRDFTINALSISLFPQNFGEVIDPFNGLLDLENKIIKTPLNPITTFNDDPLRMMRAIRFATQLNFIIDEDTLNAIKTVCDRIHIITQERITIELLKIMESPKPSIGWHLLKDTGLLKHIFPTLLELVGVENIDGKKHKENFSHSLEVLDNVAAKTENSWLRWAALLHDIGKPFTKKFSPETGWTFHGHEVVGSKMIFKIFTKLKLPLQDNMKYVKKIISLHHRPISLTKENISDSAIRRLLFDAGDDIDDLMLLCEADITSKNKFKVITYLNNFALVKEKLKAIEEKDKIRNWQPPISGELIMQLFNLQPSKIVGILKDHIRESILEGIIPNDYTAAYNLLIKKAAELNLYPTNL